MSKFARSKSEKIKKLPLLLYLSLAIFLAFLLWNFSLLFRFNHKIMHDLTDSRFNSINRAVAIVPGASVLPGKKPSRVLRERLDKSIELYHNKKVGKILLSGDNSTLYYDEVNVMKDYLIKKLVKPEDLFLDHVGLSTYDSLYRAKNFFQVRQAVIVSQDIFLRRSLYISSCLNLDYYGYVADSGYSETGFQTHLREFAARFFAFIDCYLISRQAEFSGKVIEIDGDGRKTWNRD